MRNKIIVKFNGGLGNQMSQYAMIKFLQYLYPDRTVWGDKRAYKQEKIHNGFELKKIFKNADFESYHVGRRIKNKLINMQTFEQINQEYFSGYPEDQRVYNLDQTKSYVLNGVWHNFNYSKILDTLLHDFCFPAITDSYNLDMLRLIKNSESVSVHVRKGDYCKLGLDILNKEYYAKAIEIIEQKAQNPTYFIFSDENAEEMFNELTKKQRVYFVKGNIGNRAFIDMQLMKSCKYNIIANSTFSYWGGVLNETKDKLVIRPKMQTKTNKTWEVEGWILL